MGRSPRAVILLLLTAVAAVSCRQIPAAREYAVNGQVLAVRADRREVVIRHDDIKGFMPAMTMPFRVKDERLLQAASPGAVVTATLVVADGDAWLSRIVDTGRREPLPPDADGAPHAMDLPLEPGALVPDVQLVDQSGRRFSLKELRGRSYALTFVYTRCPLPTFCPALDRQFARLQQRIAQEAPLAGARLVSVSIDPEHDRPAVLEAHARRLDADPRIWTFATGETAAIDAFGERFGLSVMRGDTPDDLVHSLRTVVVDREGRLVRTWHGAEWEVDEVSAALREAAR